MSQSSRVVGRLVSVAQAAQLAHRSEHAVRYRIQTGALTAQRGEDGRMRIDLDALSQVPGWRVDETLVGRLDQRDQPAAVAALEARLRALERRVRDLERRAVTPDEPTVGDLPTIEPPPERGPRTVTLADRGAGRPLSFATASAAARWLMRHGIHSEYTPRTWRGWPPRPLTREVVLTFAQTLLAEARSQGNWRVTWRLRRCDDPLCICQSQVEDAPEEEFYE